MGLRYSGSSMEHWRVAVSAQRALVDYPNLCVEATLRDGWHPKPHSVRGSVARSAYTGGLSTLRSDPPPIWRHPCLRGRAYPARPGQRGREYCLGLSNRVGRLRRFWITCDVVARRRPAVSQSDVCCLSRVALLAHVLISRARVPCRGGG